MTIPPAEPAPSVRDHAGAGTLPREVDAVVIGAGPNGLVAANALADAGWDVLVLEAEEQPGGAVRTAEVVAPGFRSDLFSAFYPLAAASPVIRDLHLEEHGLAWRRSPDVLAHALDHVELRLVGDVDPDLGRGEGGGYVGEQLAQPAAALGDDLDQAQRRVDAVVEAEPAVGEEDVTAHLAGEQRALGLHHRLDQRVT
ncbi:MAG TPA: FAD-dependent oxidoreductase, partial [Actinotalea sp.]|nr:FAD-dependent oxidoreductase [Actinotalea sp.]